METWTQWWPTLKCQKFIVKLQFYNEVNLLCMNPPQSCSLSSEIHWWGACLPLWTGLWQLSSEGQRFRSAMVWVNRYWCQGQELLRGRDQAIALDHQRQWMWCPLERDELAWLWPDSQGSWLWLFGFRNLRTEIIGSLLRSYSTWLESSWQRVVASYLSSPRPDSIHILSENPWNKPTILKARILSLAQSELG